MSDGFVNQEVDQEVQGQEGQVQEAESMVSEEPQAVENTAVQEVVAGPPVDIEALTKGHGKVEVVDGEKRLLGKRGYIKAVDARTILICSNSVEHAAEVRSAIPTHVMVSETNTAVSVDSFNVAKKLIRMKRKVSQQVSELRRERMRVYWERKRAVNHPRLKPGA